MIGERLLELRKDAGLTQDELAAILKINKHSISSYEREKSEPPDFKVSIDYLLGITDNPSPYDNHYNVLKLPQKFPERAKASIMDYADYLKNKYKQ